MNNVEKLAILKTSHQEMVEWWKKNVDIDGGTQAPCGFYVFLQNLLTFSDDYWNKWIGNKIPKDKKTPFRQYIIKQIIEHYSKSK